MPFCLSRGMSRKAYETPKKGSPSSSFALQVFIWNVIRWFSLKTKGLDISDKGVSIKTQKRFDRENYVDATQRCVCAHWARVSTSSFAVHRDL